LEDGGVSVSEVEDVRREKGNCRLRAAWYALRNTHCWGATIREGKAGDRHITFMGEKGN
jgi:hypothetical protein